MEGLIVLLVAAVLVAGLLFLVRGRRGLTILLLVVLMVGTLAAIAQARPPGGPKRYAPTSMPHPPPIRGGG